MWPSHATTHFGASIRHGPPSSSAVGAHAGPLQQPQQQPNLPAPSFFPFGFAPQQQSCHLPPAPSFFGAQQQPGHLPSSSAIGTEAGAVPLQQYQYQPQQHGSVNNIENTMQVTQCDLWNIDTMFEQLGCLGKGGFASVFLARKRSSKRLVALKVLDMRPGQENTIGTIFREVEAVKTLSNEQGYSTTTTPCQYGATRNRDMHIVHIQNLYITPLNAIIEMNYVDGGTLAQLIDQQDPIKKPFAERRIAWYILQLCDALAFVHERGVAHFDVKSENILVDASAGGRLVLTDFGSAVRSNKDEVVGIAESYASPELLAIHRAKKNADSKSTSSFDYKTIDPLDVDAFGLGCVALELIMTRRLVDIPLLGRYEKTLADVALEGKLVELVASCNHTKFYSDTLVQDVVLRLLDPNPQSRLRPSRKLAHYFRQDPRSPLLRPYVEASYPTQHRQHLAMDNIQLGTFVQRGPDWSDDDGDFDGGEGSIGVVVQLDPDALYAEVLWNMLSQETAVYRIGQGCKMELSVAPTPLFPGAPNHGMVERSGHLLYSVGSPFDSGNLPPGPSLLIIARVTYDKLFLLPRLSFKVPNQFRSIPSMDGPPPPSLQKLVLKEELQVIPESWDLSLGELAQPNEEETKLVLSMFHKTMPKDQYKVVKIQRVQSTRLWETYTMRRQAISHENWGTPNEMRLFHGTRATKPKEIIADPVGFDPRYCDKGAYGRGSYFAERADYSHHFKHEVKLLFSQMFLAKTLVGRVDDRRNEDRTTAKALRRPKDGCHSVLGTSVLPNGTRSNIYVHYETSTQAYPEFLIMYCTQEHYNMLGPTAVDWYLKKHAGPF